MSVGRSMISEMAEPTMALRWHRGTLQQAWHVTRYFDARMERHEGVRTTEWRDVPYSGAIEDEKLQTTDLERGDGR